MLAFTRGDLGSSSTNSVSHRLDNRDFLLLVVPFVRADSAPFAFTSGVFFNGVAATEATSLAPVSLAIKPASTPSLEILALRAVVRAECRVGLVVPADLFSLGGGCSCCS